MELRGGGGGSVVSIELHGFDVRGLSVMKPTSCDCFIDCSAFHALNYGEPTVLSTGSCRLVLVDKIQPCSSSKSSSFLVILFLTA